MSQLPAIASTRTSNPTTPAPTANSPLPTTTPAATAEPGDIELLPNDTATAAEPPITISTKSFQCGNLRFANGLFSVATQLCHFVLDPERHVLKRLAPAPANGRAPDTHLYYESISLVGARVSLKMSDLDSPPRLQIREHKDYGGKRWELRLPLTSSNGSLEDWHTAITGLLLTNVVPTPQASPLVQHVFGQLGISPVNWMECLRTRLQHRKLTRVALPGSHDAATHELTTSRDYVPCHDGPHGFLAAAFKKTAVLWSIAQGVSIREQLLRGIRYLDLRIVYCPNRQPTLWTCHGILSSSLPEILNDIKQFLTEHPFEFLLLDVNELHQEDLCRPGNHRMDARGHSATLTLFEETLGPWLLSVNMGSDITLGELWQTPYRIVTFYDDATVAPTRPWLWARNKHLRSHWKDKANPTLLFEAINDEIRQHGRSQAKDDQKRAAINSPHRVPSPAAMESFWVLQCVLTPTPVSFVKGVACCGCLPNSLKHYSEIVLDPLLHFVSTDLWRTSNINVVMVDHADDPEFIAAIVGLNV